MSRLDRLETAFNKAITVTVDSLGETDIVESFSTSSSSTPLLLIKNNEKLLNFLHENFINNIKNVEENLLSKFLTNLNSFFNIKLSKMESISRLDLEKELLLLYSEIKQQETDEIEKKMQNEIFSNTLLEENENKLQDILSNQYDEELNDIEKNYEELLKKYNEEKLRDEFFKQQIENELNNLNDEKNKLNFIFNNFNS